MMPLLYRWGASAYTRHLAREAARSDLASGNGALYISYSQLKSIFFRASFPPVDPLTGLLIRDALHGTEGKLHMEAYNTTIENELAKQGTYPITRYLLNRKQMARLVNTAPFVDTDELPLSIGRNLLIDLQDGNVMLNGRRIYQPPKKYAVVDEPPGLVIVMRDNQVWTVLPDGSPVQRAYLRKEFGAWTVPPQPSHLMPAP